MIKLGEFSADGYGMAIISTDLFTEYLKEKKCRAKKLLSYFDNNKDLFFDSVKNGRFLPFYKISAFEYQIFLSVNEENPELPDDYEQVYRYNNFFIEAGGLEKICLASFDYIEYHSDNIKSNITDKENEIPSGPDDILEKYYPARGFNLEKGIYEFDLIGLKRKKELDRESKNFAFAFLFRKNNKAINNNFEKADNCKYNFDIISFNN